jgi:hypothetical protein
MTQARKHYGDPELPARFAKLLRESTEEELLVHAYNSPAVHFSCFCSIRDDNNQLIQSPAPNILQLRMSHTFETLRDLGIRVRIIAVKPRRAGCSSFAAHIGYHSSQVKPIEGITISDIKDHSEELLAKLKDYGKTDSYPWENPQTRSATHSIGWANGSSFVVDTAENADAGVGGTRQFGHFSEVSKWPQTQSKNDKKVMSAVTPSLSGMETTIIAESTPEGATGWHYETWQNAVWLEDLLEMIEKGIRPEEIWVKVFAAWYEFDSNKRQTPVSEQEIAQIKATLDDHEKREIELYDLTWEQIAWRRDTIASKCNGDPRIFSFYYPSDDVSCWIGSGSPRFDMTVLQKMKIRAGMAIPSNGWLHEQDDGQVTFHDSRGSDGIIQIWEKPLMGLRYLMCIDPAGDLSQTVGADPDRHSVNVWRAAYHDTASDIWRPAKKVARVIPPYYADGDEVAEQAVLLSKYYGKCITAIEINCGLDIMRLLQMAGVPLYKRKPLSHRTGQVVEQIGFRMGDKQERNALIEGFAAAIRTEAIEVLCLHSIDEYMSFIVNTKKGRAEAASGKHDDDVMADAIAWEIMPNATTYQTPRARHTDPPDRKRWKTVNSVRRGF